MGRSTGLGAENRAVDQAGSTGKSAESKDKQEKGIVVVLKESEGLICGTPAKNVSPTDLELQNFMKKSLKLKTIEGL